jgi:hypothetical protein
MEIRRPSGDDGVCPLRGYSKTGFIVSSSTGNGQAQVKEVPLARVNDDLARYLREAQSASVSLLVTESRESAASSARLSQVACDQRSGTDRLDAKGTHTAKTKAEEIARQEEVHDMPPSVTAQCALACSTPYKSIPVVDSIIEAIDVLACLTPDESGQPIKRRWPSVSRRCWR